MSRALAKLLDQTSAGVKEMGVPKATEIVNQSAYERLRREQPFVNEYAKKTFQEKDSAMRRANAKAGVRTSPSVEKFEDIDGKIYRTNPTVKGKTGVPEYSLYEQTAKDTRNSKVAPARKEDIEATTRTGDEHTFYKDRGRAERKMDAHHLAELDRTAPIFSGLQEYSRRALFKYLERRGIRPGHIAENRIDIQKKLHQEFHSWFDKKYGRKSFEGIQGLSLTQRKKYIDQFIKENQASLEKLFELKNRSALRRTQKRQEET